MNFDFTEEQKLFAHAMRKFAVAELEANALKRAHNPRFPFAVAQRMSRQGIAGGSVEILKSRIAEEIFDHRFDQRGNAAE
jgi:hypothetical protein